MLIPKKDWKVYNFKGNELSRQVTGNYSALRVFLSIRYRKGEIQLCNTVSSYTNCCFTEKKDTRSPYMTLMADNCECYKLHLPGCDCYILTKAFEDNYRDSQLHLITELPEEVIDHCETELTLEGYIGNLITLLSTFLDKSAAGPCNSFRYLDVLYVLLSIKLESSGCINRDMIVKVANVSIHYNINNHTTLYFECSTIEEVDTALNSIIYKTMHLEPSDYFYKYDELRNELCKKLSKFIIDS
jgi:hypothetical protein